MTDSKNGFRMVLVGGTPTKYNVMFNFNSVGEIKSNPHVEGEWVFFADWNGGTWTANSLSEAKKIAKRELKAMFKKHKL